MILRTNDRVEDLAYKIYNAVCQDKDKCDSCIMSEVGKEAGGCYEATYKNPREVLDLLFLEVIE